MGCQLEIPEVTPKRGKGYNCSSLYNCKSKANFHSIFTDPSSEADHVSSSQTLTAHTYCQNFTDTKGRLCFTQQHGDLFHLAGDNTSLAHCVSSDMKMSDGIAFLCKQKFGRVEELLKFKPQVGKCYYLNDKERKIFYLVTKKRFHDKPRYHDLEQSLQNLRNLCDNLKVKNLAMPKIGCGLDKLDWTIVSKIIDTIFDTSETQITVYFLQTLSNLTTQPIVSDVQTINKVELSKQVDNVYVTIQGKPQHGYSRCIIEAFINDHPVQTLIDTGADSCYIDQNLCHQLGLQVEPYDCDVIVGNQQRISVLGKVIVPVTIVDCQYPIVCIVVAVLSHELILGWDGFITKYHGIIDSKTNILRLLRPTISNNNFLYLEDSLTLPPFTEC